MSEICQSNLGIYLYFVVKILYFSLILILRGITVQKFSKEMPKTDLKELGGLFPSFLVFLTFCPRDIPLQDPWQGMIKPERGPSETLLWYASDINDKVSKRKNVSASVNQGFS